MNVDVGLSSDLLEEMVGIVLRYCDPKKILVYGSRARGDYDKRSDIDIAIDCEEDIDFLRAILEEDVRTLLKFDVVKLPTANENLNREIERESVVLYEKV